MSDTGDTKARPRRLRRVLTGMGLAALVAAGGLAAYVVSLGPLPLETARQVSTEIADRNGKLLRAFALADGRWRLGVRDVSDVDPRYVNLLLAYEDRRFREHSGIDPRALVFEVTGARARKGRLKSGFLRV